jgi:hypothetical protein
MIVGLSLKTFTIVHVVISLVGIASGLVVLYGLLVRKRLPAWTALFLATTVATSVTGFMFPFEHFTPGDAVGIISLVVLAVAILSRYVLNMAGAARWIYIITAMIAEYLNVFVLIVQSFQKVPALKALAPTQSEPPFVAAQVVVMVIFVALTIAAAIRFRVEQAPIE